MQLYEEFKLYENLWEHNKHKNPEVLTEANPAQQLNGMFGFNRECPGCGMKFTADKDCAIHALDCEKAKELLSKRSAIVRVSTTGHDFDYMPNISALALIKYINEHAVCEICGTPLSTLDDRRPDHKHLSDTSPVPGVGRGSFRGVLCNSCNLMLGTFEKKKLDINKIATYLNNASAKIAQFNNET